MARPVLQRSEDSEAEQRLPLGYVAHTSASRTRLSFPDFKGQEDLLVGLCAALRQLPGIQSAEGRPLTGSVIIAHDGSTDDLVQAASEARLFEVGELPQHSGPLADAVALKDRADQILQDAIGPSVNLRTIAAFAFIAMALRQLAAGSIMPPAATALWYGLSLLLAVNPEAGSTPEDAGE